jgi:hypothetical protein
MVLKGITLDRLQDRNNLLASLDQLKREHRHQRQDGRARYVHVRRRSAF